MKNEERIIELLIETLQRIDRHQAEIERLNEKFNRHSEQFDRHSEHFDRHSEQFDRHSELIRLVVDKLQNHEERLDRHGEAFGALRERTEEMHQTALEQQKAYQAMTELLMHHNRALTAKGIL